MRSTNPRDYWNLLNQGQKNHGVSNISVDILKEHFEKLNESNDTEDDDYFDPNSNTLENPVLDADFTEAEVRKVIKK